MNAKNQKLAKFNSLVEKYATNEAAFLVGYNGTAQFSREYKRQFGFVPSET